jgi:transcriptional regulator with XRE-family HTH domain
MTQETLAHLAGVHPTYLSAVERGTRNIALRNIVALAGALGVPVAELFQGVEPPPAADE